MATLTGTSGTDTLIGTAGNDVLVPLGTSQAGAREILRGLDGADTYDLRRGGPSGYYDFLIDDRGTDGAADSIVNVGGFYASASLGYRAWATAVRQGDDLVIHTPSTPARFHSPARPAYDIRIKDHYGVGQVETLQAGGVTYNLVTGTTGTATEDLMAGSRAADSLSAGAGDDWIFGNGGRDVLNAGAGNDVVFGGAGRDGIVAGAGSDTVFGGSGGDRIRLGAGNDQGYGEAGNDRILGQGGNDWLIGGDGNDVLRGGAGGDVIRGDAGDDLLIGGRGGDIYEFSAPDPANGWGHDVIREAGNRPVGTSGMDRVSLSGLYGPPSGTTADAYARLAFLRVGSDMEIRLDGGQSTILVQNMFSANPARWFVEQIVLKAGYWNAPLFQILSVGKDAIGDDRGAPLYEYSGAANEIIFGSDAGEQIYGDAGTNFIWTGAGADTLIYKENDGSVWFDGTYYYSDGGSWDIVQDFDVMQDRLDFSQIASVTSLADLTIGQDAQGDATIFWDSGRFDVADILIELRGVTMAEITADLFIFA